MQTFDSHNRSLRGFLLGAIEGSPVSSRLPRRAAIREWARLQDGLTAGPEFALIRRWRLVSALTVLSVGLLASGGCGSSLTAPFGNSTPQTTATVSPPASPAVLPVTPAPAERPETTKVALSTTSKSKGEVDHRFIVFVNGEPISKHQVELRAKMALLSSPELQKRMQARIKSPKINDEFKAFATKRLAANPPQTKEELEARIKPIREEFLESLQQQVRAGFTPVARESALEELIQEKLKMQAATTENVVVGEEEVDQAFQGIAERNKMTAKEFADYIGSKGGDASVMRERLRANLSWRNVLRRRLVREVSISERDIDRMIATAPDTGDDVDLQLRRIVLPLPAKLAKNTIASRYQDAELLRAKFENCANISKLSADPVSAKIEDLGVRKASSLVEPTRSILLDAQEGSITSPILGEGVIEMYAVCGRQIVSADKEKRSAAEQQLRQDTLQRLESRELKNLRDVAVIEQR